MDKWKRKLDQLRDDSGMRYFDLVDGSRFYLDPDPVFTQNRWAFLMECVNADMERRMRPEPHPYYKALCQAKDRRAAVRLFYPEWDPEKSTRNPVFPYNLWTLIEEGRLEDFPFAPGVSVFKVSGKMFALTRLSVTPLQVSVKCDPLLAESLRESYTSIVPGYHLNKRHWITITVAQDASDAMVYDLIQDSYDLVKPRRGFG